MMRIARPTVAARLLACVNASVTRDDNQLNELAQLGFPGASGPTVSDSSQATLSLTQPLYTGGLVSSQVTAAEASVLAGREGLREVEEQVLQNVITAYVNVRRDQESLAIAQDNTAVLHQQLAESEARFEVGEITRTDVAETQAQVAAAEAQLSTAQAPLAEPRDRTLARIGALAADCLARAIARGVYEATPWEGAAVTCWRDLE